MNTPAGNTALNAVIAVYDSNVPAKSTLQALRRAGFEMEKLSIIGKRYRAEERALGFYCTGERITACGGIGGFWGTIWSLLTGPAVSAVPQVGLVAAAGPFGLALLGARESDIVADGFSALVAALVGLGIPKDQAAKYEADVKAHRFLVLVHGSAEDIARARSLLPVSTTPARPEWLIHG